MLMKKHRKQTPKRLAQLRNERAKKAQAGQGAPNVLAFKSYRDIPTCMFPLFTDAAKKAYDTVIRAKYDSGKLTLGMLTNIAQYALAVDGMTRNALAGKPPRAAMNLALEKATMKLDLDDEKTVIAAPEEAPINRFANTGFSSRGRQMLEAGKRRR